MRGHLDRIRQLESELAMLRSSSTRHKVDSFDGNAAYSILGQRVSMDDLKVVEGIGPKIEELCHAAGIRTWRQLAAAPVAKLREILHAAGPNFQIHDPETWPKQAELLADGRWAEFKTLTDELIAGRKA